MCEKKKKFPPMCRCRDFTVASLEDFLETVDFLKVYICKPKNRHPILWYRGQARQHYHLLPSLFRGYSDYGSEYGRNHLREDYRYQHFRSKTAQLVRTDLESKIEWMELMQHHFIKTRLMDWSESGISALLFALEAFINPSADNELLYQRRTVTPTVWILDPIKLNEHVYEAFLNKPELIRLGFQEFDGANQHNSLYLDTLSRMRTGKDRFLMYDGDHSNDGVVCLSVIESERQANAGRMASMLRDGIFNPYFYLLLKYFSDGLPVPVSVLPPLAVVHPYHSTRIQAQHGVFTVTPHYNMKGIDKDCGVDFRAMEFQPKIADCLYRIRITSPSRVAKELLLLGERRTGLYPELENYAKDIEASNLMI